MPFVPLRLRQVITDRPSSTRERRAARRAFSRTNCLTACFLVLIAPGLPEHSAAVGDAEHPCNGGCSVAGNPHAFGGFD